MVNCATNEGLAQESVWYEKFRYEDAERQMFEQMAKQQGSSGAVSGSVVAEIMKARDHIKHSLAAVENVSAMVAAAGSPDLSSRLQKLEIEVAGLKKVTDDLSARLSDELRALVMGLDSRVKALEASKPAPAASQPAKAPAAAPAPAPAAADDDDEDVDLFGSDEEEDEEAERIKAERVAAYAAKKSNKPVLIAKSSILLDVKPWDDETDMKEMERKVRTIEADGLLWAAQSKLVPLAYGIMKLQIGCVIEDDKISVDWLTETIQEFEDLVQSVDIAQFNKI